MENLISELTYISYATNRDNAPQITPERWAKIYSNVATMEIRYQDEKIIQLN